MDVEILSRIQFALTISFHYIYPPLSIGLGVMLVVIEGLWMATKNPLYHQLARFWTKVFALTFAIGVATGIVMEFEFGTNWAAYSRYVGDVFGSALAAEGIFAFFLESGFLAILLFGWDKVGPKMHYFATVMVCLGAHFSAVWIVVANSWMQTPAGFHIVGEGLAARAQITDFWAMVFNPSSMDRLFHTDFARASLRLGLVVGFVASLLQLVSGDSSARTVAKHQPAKLAAMEGIYETTTHAPLSLFGWVDEKGERVLGPVVPGMLSYLAFGDASAPVKGLNEFPPKDRPLVQPVFQFYHLMVGIGLGMIAVSGLGCFMLWRGRVFERRWMLWLLVPTVLGPQIANQAGWFTAEMGRQPWIVYGLMRTSEGLSAVVKAHTVLTSLILFTLLYMLLFGVFVYVLNDKIQHGPDAADLNPTGKLALPFPDKPS
jgi:cytochrome d ubiquinol oxidase subunit I